MSNRTKQSTTTQAENKTRQERDHNRTRCTDICLTQMHPEKHENIASLPIFGTAVYLLLIGSRYLGTRYLAGDSGVAEDNRKGKWTTEKGKRSHENKAVRKFEHQSESGKHTWKRRRKSQTTKGDWMPPLSFLFRRQRWFNIYGGGPYYLGPNFIRKNSEYIWDIY